MLDVQNLAPVIKSIAAELHPKANDIAEDSNTHPNIHPIVELYLECSQLLVNHTVGKILNKKGEVVGERGIKIVPNENNEMKPTKDHVQALIKKVCSEERIEDIHRKAIVFFLFDKYLNNNVAVITQAWKQYCDLFVTSISLILKIHTILNDIGAGKKNESKKGIRNCVSKVQEAELTLLDIDDLYQMVRQLMDACFQQNKITLTSVGKSGFIGICDFVFRKHELMNDIAVDEFFEKFRTSLSLSLVINEVNEKNKDLILATKKLLPHHGAPDLFSGAGGKMRTELLGNISLVAEKLKKADAIRVGTLRSMLELSMISSNQMVVGNRPVPRGCKRPDGFDINVIILKHLKQILSLAIHPKKVLQESDVKKYVANIIEHIVLWGNLLRKKNVFQNMNDFYLLGSFLLKNDLVLEALIAFSKTASLYDEFCNNETISKHPEIKNNFVGINGARSKMEAAMLCLQFSKEGPVIELVPLSKDDENCLAFSCDFTIEQRDIVSQDDYNALAKDYFTSAKEDAERIKAAFLKRSCSKAEREDGSKALNEVLERCKKGLKQLQPASCWFSCMGPKK